tara:strand:+ start:1799 stop:2398 length:600 start_codon:yes stop_codon:yes gene_type:complete
MVDAKIPLEINGRLILGSKSPRRKELLQVLNIPFEVKTSEADEIAPEGLDDIETVSWVARQKSDSLLPSLLPGEILITADTEVWMNGLRFGKPKNTKQAYDMLTRLSGQKHRVITSIWATDGVKWENSTVITVVTFNNLPKNWLMWYVKEFKPLDKAGGYGVQEWIGHVGIKHIDGSYDNVKGLPLTAVLEVLKPWILK